LYGNKHKTIISANPHRTTILLLNHNCLLDTQCSKTNDVKIFC